MKRTSFMATLIVLLISGIQAANSTVFPIPEETIKRAFSNEELARSLEEALDKAERTLDRLHDVLARYEGYAPPKAFTPAKYKKTYTLEQIKEWKETGWVKTNEFGWPILKRKINEVLPGWLEGFEQELKQAEKDFPEPRIPEEVLRNLVKKEEALSDFIALQRSYVNRTMKWDERCTRGPWLLENSPPGKLAREIQILTDHLEGHVTAEEVLRGLCAFPSEDGEATRKALAACLDAKRTVYDWYHGFHAGGKHAMKVTLTPRGYEFRVSLCLHGKGVRPQAAATLKAGIEGFWDGSVTGIPFKTLVTLRRPAHSEPEPRDCLKVRIGAEDEKNIWPSDTQLPFNFDPETAAHEFGHAVGFRDRYRDVYDFTTGTYKTFQWDLFNLMSAQNSPTPIVTEEELSKIVEHYSADNKPESDR